VAAAIAPDPLWHPRRVLEIFLQIRRQNLRRQTALREEDQLQIAFEELARDSARLAEIRATDPELMVDDRRVDEHEVLLAARRAALLHQLERTLGESLGEVARI